MDDRGVGDGDGGGSDVVSGVFDLLGGEGGTIVVIVASGDVDGRGVE